MRRVEFNRILKKLDATQRSIKLANSMIRERSERPKYPDVFSLETYVRGKQVECKFNYECTLCPTKKRNVCWKEARKIDNKKVLLAGIPYPRIILSEMRIANLWILAAHLGAQTVTRSKSDMVDAIVKAQHNYDIPEPVKLEKKGEEIAESKKEKGSSKSSVKAKKMAKKKSKRK